MKIIESQNLEIQHITQRIHELEQTNHELNNHIQQMDSNYKKQMVSMEEMISNQIADIRYQKETISRELKETVLKYESVIDGL